jgi:hypothetical protein
MKDLVNKVKAHYKGAILGHFWSKTVTKNTFSHLRQVKKWGFSTSEYIVTNIYFLTNIVLFI